MSRANHRAIAALILAGSLWGITVPLSKLVLPWLGPAWLAVARFGLGAAVLAVVGRHGIRRALRPSIVATGTFGFGAVIVIQSAGISQTSVSHAAVIVGVVPVLVALWAAASRQAVAPPRAWLGYATALGGISLLAGSGHSGVSLRGDLLVLASAALSAAFIVLQPRLLTGRDPAAVTTVEFGAGALAALPLALLTAPAPGAPGSVGPAIALAALCLAGTVLPFWLFAYGQSRVPAHVAGPFVNLEPAVGAAAGWIAFADPVTPLGLAGGVAALAGIGLSTLPPGSAARLRRLRHEGLPVAVPDAEVRPA